MKLVRDPYQGLNKYHINRLGKVVVANEDGSFQQLGLKAQVVGNLALFAVTSGLIAYGYWLARVSNPDLEAIYGIDINGLDLQHKLSAEYRSGFNAGAKFQEEESEI